MLHLSARSQLSGHLLQTRMGQAVCPWGVGLPACRQKKTEGALGEACETPDANDMELPANALVAGPVPTALEQSMPIDACEAHDGSSVTARAAVAAAQRCEAGFRSPAAARHISTSTRG
jgi:hypothetical protein